jgi:hypothetical protein
VQVTIGTKKLTEIDLTRWSFRPVSSSVASAPLVLSSFPPDAAAAAAANCPIRSIQIARLNFLFSAASNEPSNEFRSSVSAVSDNEQDCTKVISFPSDL